MRKIVSINTQARSNAYDMDTIVNNILIVHIKICTIFGFER